MQWKDAYSLVMMVMNVGIKWNIEKSIGLQNKKNSDAEFN